jgi:hypothetical protein
MSSRLGNLRLLFVVRSRQVDIELIGKYCFTIFLPEERAGTYLHKM